MTPEESLPACDKGMRRYKHSTGVCSTAEWPEPLHECLQLQGNQIRSKTELPDLCRCGRACARSAAHEILGERQRRWWGLFWWRGSINIALLPSRLLVCLSRTSTMLHHTPHTTHHTTSTMLHTTAEEEDGTRG